MIRCVAACVAALTLLGTNATTARAEDGPRLRIATFNASLNRAKSGELVEDLSTGDNEQARNAAETIQRAAADIILINEFDYDEKGEAVELFLSNYLNVSQRGATAVDYPYWWAGPVNTGVQSGFDLDNDGETGGPNDAYGFGLFPGQYGFVVFSKYPIVTEQIRTFQKFLWKDMPNNLIPEDWFSTEELDHVRLSSKTHADIPVSVAGQTLHVLAAHPTPPSFDGPEKRNKRRNNDEIRLWSDYIGGTGDYLYDDTGKKGGLAAGDSFVILGDYNSDPLDGDSWPGSIAQLLKSEYVLDPMPKSKGAVEAAKRQGGANDSHLGDPALDTADFGDDPRPGNIRVDYTLLSKATLRVKAAEVFWPERSDQLFRLVGEYPFPTSDHRLVWVDAEFVENSSADPEPAPNISSQPVPNVPRLPHTGC